MERFYLKYNPVKAGATGVEYIAPFLYEHFNNEVTFKNAISDGIIHYGILEGQGDVLSKVLLTLDNKFSIMKLTELEFIGACYLLYKTPILPNGLNGHTFSGYMFNVLEIAITEEKIINGVKDFKKLLFKEITKKKFPNDNDSIADISKSITLFTHYYDLLTPDQKSEVDDATEILKTIYNVDTCILAYKNLVENLQLIMSSYYIAKQQVDDSTSVIDIQNITYP